MNALRPVLAQSGAARWEAAAARRFEVWLLCCVAITLLLSFGGLIIGTSSIDTSLHWLLAPDAQSSVVLWQIRLPRTVGAWFAGALLGLAGAIAQGVFRNPLAEPYLLGTASGAALGVTICLMGADAAVGGLPGPAIWASPPPPASALALPRCSRSRSRAECCRPRACCSRAS